MPAPRAWLLLLVLTAGCDKPTPPTTAPAEVPPPAPAPEPEPKKEPPKKKDLPPSTTGRVSPDQPYVLGSVRVTVKKATIGKVPLKNADGSISYSEEPRLMVALRIDNLNERRKLNYASWVPDLDESKSVGKLTDDAGAEAKRVSLGFGNNVKDRTAFAEVNPSASINDLLLFEVPAATAKHFDLDLPGVNCGVRGTFQFRIDAAAVVRAK